MTRAIPVANSRRPTPARALLRGLSTRFLLLTIAFVMVIEMLILVPSVANFRQTWLMGRLEQSQAALGILDQTLGDEMLQEDLLDALDAEAIVLRNAERTHRVAKPGLDYASAQTVRAGDLNPVDAIRDAWKRLRNTNDAALIRLVGMEDELGRQIEVVIRAMPLRDAMLVYMRNIVLISLLIAIVTAVLIYAATRAMLIRPVQQLTGSMLAFAADPRDTSSIIDPSARQDELGQAQRELATMQRQLHSTLDQQRRLAELGLAVSKINHDMRNILASAQLVSDRLADVEDPVVQRMAPRLIRALDRAVSYSEGVLDYGRTGEASPEKERVPLRSLVDDVVSIALEGRDNGVVVENTVPAEHVIHADREHMVRVLLNLMRNALQAMNSLSDGARKCVTFAVRSDGTDDVITVRDTGPGIPDNISGNLFSAFGGSTKSGGTGLGLAIARELVEAHGGSIAVSQTGPQGTTFAIHLPREREFTH